MTRLGAPQAGDPIARLRSLMPFLILECHPALSAAVRLLEEIERADAETLKRHGRVINPALDSAERIVTVKGNA